ATPAKDLATPAKDLATPAKDLAPPRRLLTPASAARRPWPRAALLVLVVALLFGVVTGRGGYETLNLVGRVVAAVAGCAVGAWLEQRLFQRLLGSHPILRLLATLAAPILFLALVLPLFVLVTVPFAMLGDRGAGPNAAVLAGFWAAFMAFGTATMVFIDVVVSLLVRDFRSRVQLAVISLLGAVLAMSWALLLLGRRIAHEIVTRIQAGDLPADFEIDLGFDKLRGDDFVQLVQAGEADDFLAYGIVFVGMAMALPAVLSACGKLADGVMERLNPLTRAIDEVTQGHLDLRVEEAGSRDFRHLAEGFNRMVVSLDHTLQELDRNNRDLAELNRAATRFVPLQFLQLLDRDSLRDVARGDQIELDLSIMFADIRGFTTTSERLGPEATFALINRFLAHMEPAIVTEGGFINEFMGDGIMALFHSADGAVRAALAMLRALDTLNAELAEDGQAPLRIGIGINSGSLMLGTIGGRERLSCTVIGDPANTASRTEGMTKLYGAGLLITEATHARLADPDQYWLRDVDCVQAKGKQQPMIVYEVLDGEPPSRRKARTAAAPRFAEGVTQYREGRFEAARATFAELAAELPDDGAVALYLRRLAALDGRPPADWDGVTRLDQK
ncbi:MAG: adenylate/guanylate cyclase domain-containing protein, partial [Myxococcales bacterium]|nr:adenylate/guanylate cyclase domain-containing protein [Myxococcales bacterium]